MSLADYIGSTDERDALLDTDAVAESVTYTPNGGEAASIKGIFTAPYEGLDPATMETETVAPIFLCFAADLTGTVHGGTILRDGTTYTIKEKHDSEDGAFTTLILSE